MRWVVLLVFAALLLAGCAKPAPVGGETGSTPSNPTTTNPAEGGAKPATRPTSAPPTSATPSPTPVTPASDPLLPPLVSQPKVVIAIIDDGLNAYHAAFRDASARAQFHPSQYIAGYPAEAKPIRLTFNHETVAAALKADCAEWAKVEPGQLYYFPGTRIVGAITFGSAPITCEKTNATGDGDILGKNGHGTMTTSRAAGNEIGACPDCLVTIVQGFSGKGVAWAASQPWIDIQSNSWGPITPAPGVVDDTLQATTTPAFAKLVETAAQAQLSFWATGNGAAHRLGVLGHPSQADFHFTPSVIRVGADDSGRIALWPGSGPHVASDGCSSWAAIHGTMDKASPTQGSGTSAATPFAAGVAGRVLLAARTLMADFGTGEREGALAVGKAVAGGPLDDGQLTRDELLALYYHTADPRPRATQEDGPACDATDAFGPGLGPVYGSLPAEWSSVPAGSAQLPLIGYGVVSIETAQNAISALRGEKMPAPRDQEDSWFAYDNTIRQAEYDAFVSAS